MVTAKTGSPIRGHPRGGNRCAAQALDSCFMVVSGANQLAVGLAMMFLGSAHSLPAAPTSRKINGLNDVPIPLLSDLPFVGPIIFDHEC